MLYPFRVPRLLQMAFPDVIWKENNTDSQRVYLTFDDGPDPKSTPVLIDILEKYKVTASHFLMGK